MSINARITNGLGDGNQLNLEKDGSANVTVQGVPPDNVDYALKPFVSFFTNSSGSNDMRVNGSTNFVDFSVGSSTEGDRYVGTLAFTISDAGATLSEFGNLTALTNGCQLIYQDDRLGDVVIGDNLQSNFDFIQFCNFEPTFGSGNSAFLANNVVGVSEAFIPILDLEDVFGLPYGLKIPQSSNVKLTLRVRDNTTGVDRFDIKAFGYDKIKISD